MLCYSAGSGTDRCQSGSPGPFKRSCRPHNGKQPEYEYREALAVPKVAATTLREVHSTIRHSWGAVGWINGQTGTSPTCELDICDRVGGGDGFAAGLFYGLLVGAEPQEAVNLGWAHGALLTTFSGDTTIATLLLAGIRGS